MSTSVPFDTYKQRLIDNNVIKPKGIKIGFEELKPRSITKNESTPDEAQGSSAGETESSRIDSLNRKVDYHIEQDSNELVIKIRDKKTGEVIKQIPEEEFLRLTNRISDFNKSILDQTV
jgi:flagellar protein FlaG